MNDDLSFNQQAFIALQHLLPQHTLSRLVGLLANTKISGLKNALIRQFIERFDVDLSEAALEDPTDYDSFNAFFTRALKPDARLIDSSPEAVVSPADGCISQMGNIDGQRLLQAKGRHYTLDALLAHDSDIIKQYQDGEFMTVYLSPRDYHRVHMPCDGTLIKTIYVPGKLFSVNETTTQGVNNLFARNERLICVFDTPIGLVTIILVGAMIVAGIETVWHDYATARYGNAASVITPSPVSLKKGDEMGRFKLGSTVIMLFENNAIQWRTDKSAGSLVQMGNNVAVLTP